MRTTSLLALLLLACSPAAAPADTGTPGTDAGTLDAAGDASLAHDAARPDAACAPANDASVALPDGGRVDLRGLRYCEVLLARLGDGGITADVYNTLGLSDCPEAAWSALDAASIARAEGATAAILNGPRYWLIDGLRDSMLIDPTVRTFGCLPMRLAGRVTVAGGASVPYVPREVARDTTFVFDAGRTVYEIVDDAGHVYDMQSYSVQEMPQDEASLATLGARLTLPSGWTYRTRTLDAELLVTAVGGVATVLQDELANTYQLSQQ